MRMTSILGPVRNCSSTVRTDSPAVGPPGPPRLYCGMKIPIRTVPGFLGPTGWAGAPGAATVLAAGVATAALKLDIAACAAWRDCAIAFISVAVCACVTLVEARRANETTAT